MTWGGLLDEGRYCCINEHTVSDSGWGEESISIQESRRPILLHMCKKKNNEG